jgi:hypothetical protein
VAALALSAGVAFVHGALYSLLGLLFMGWDPWLAAAASSVGCAAGSFAAMKIGATADSAGANDVSWLPLALVAAVSALACGSYGARTGVRRALAAAKEAPQEFSLWRPWQELASLAHDVAEPPRR